MMKIEFGVRTKCASLILAVLVAGGSAEAQSSNAGAQNGSLPTSGTAAVGGYATRNTSPMRSDLASQNPVRGQGNGSADGTRQFLTNTAQDTNFEIATGKLALAKSQSADVKAYATTVIQDHTSLRPYTQQADVAAHVAPVSTTSMNADDTQMYSKLKGLSGKDFDQAYIQELVKGNQKGVEEAKSEASSSTVAAVKNLAGKRVQLDSKHTERAKQLAQAHHIQS